MDGPNKGQELNKSTKCTDPIRVNFYISPQSGRTLHGLTTRLVHKLDGPYEGKIQRKSTKWTDPTKVKNLMSPQSGLTQQGSRT